MGDYHLAVKPGPNPLPTTGLTPSALTSFWFDLVSASAGLAEERTALNAGLDRPGQSGEAFKARLGDRYARKIQIKTTESIAELLHEVLVPDAPYVCDETCPHVAFGATASQVKAFVDSLDEEISRLRGRLAESSGPVADGYRDELRVCESFVDRLARVHGALSRHAPRPSRALADAGVQVDPEEINRPLRALMGILKDAAIPEAFLHGETQSPHSLRNAFDANRLLEPFTQLRRRPGMVLDYVWRGGHHEGAPLLYAREEKARPLATVQEFTERFKVTPTGYAPDFPQAYLPGIEMADSVLGAAQLAAFLCESPLFLLHWHAHYDHVSLCVGTRGRQSLLADFPPGDQERVLALPTGAKVRRAGNLYQVEMLTFQDNEGFWLRRWVISTACELLRTEKNQVVPAAVKRFY